MHGENTGEFPSTPLVSVVVCTHNREQLLEHALESLAGQHMLESQYEILIVDNNSTDDTASIARSFCRHHGNARYCFESREGLSHARNHGWREARGVYVAYMDDDCRAPQDWVSIGISIIETISPDVFGGPYLAYFLSSRPPWFRYGNHVPGKEARFLDRHEFGALTGGNILFRRSILQRLGGFDPKLGMKASRLAYGEETELLRRISSLEPAPRLYYDPRLIMHHLVSPEKMSMQWIIRQSFVVGRYAFLAVRNGMSGGILKVFMMVVFRSMLLVMGLFKGVIMRDRSRYPYYENYLYEEAFPQIRHLGQLYEQLLQFCHRGLQM